MMTEFIFWRTFPLRKAHGVSHHISEDDSSEAVDVHVLQQSVRVLDGREVTRNILYNSLRQRKRAVHCRPFNNN